MLTRMVSICRPRDPPASASQSAGITGLSHSARPPLSLAEINETDTFGPGDDDEIQFVDAEDDDEDIENVSR